MFGMNEHAAMRDYPLILPDCQSLLFNARGLC